MNLKFAVSAVGALVATPLMIASAHAAAPNGGQLYKARCAMCHAVKAGAPSTMGPNLSKVLGRTSGTSSFNYSPAMKNAKVVWTKAMLDNYLAGPAKMMPGTRMAISVSDPAQRSAIVAYLATVK
jgi:cytochrome c